MPSLRGPTAIAWAILAVVAPQAWAAEGLPTSFFDDFDRLDPGHWYVSHGWVNGTYQNCWWSKSAVTVANGVLEVGFSDEPEGTRNHRCGEIRTRQHYLHGTIEARIRTPSGSGLNAAFFTYVGAGKGEQHDEIDFEILLKDTSRVQTTTFVNGKSGDGKTGNGVKLELPYPADSDFIDYAVAWSADRMDFYLNGRLVRTIDDPDQIPVTPQQIFLSLWGTDTLNAWMGPFEAPGRIAMEVDWVAYTAPGDKCQFPQSVVCAARQQTDAQ